MVAAWQSGQLSSRLVTRRPVTRMEVQAIDFSRKQGFGLMPNKDGPLMTNWNIPSRQVETSIVLGIEMK
ncbi:MAG: hypothetical protein KAW81_00805 [Dehalococcoidia bacterium]|nr:hypothetical protein [Dehalococcoidia bacterium]